MPSSELDLANRRFAMFAEQVLWPAVYPVSMPLEVAVWQCPEPVPYAEAVRQSYRPVTLGWRWGPAWSTAWFRLTGRVPAEWAGRAVVLRFSTETEALLWGPPEARRRAPGSDAAGAPWHGLDVNHTAAPLFDPAAGGEALALYVEATCNHPFGVVAFSWDPADLRQRWRDPDPGRLTLCELAVHDPLAWKLWRTYEFARQLLAVLPVESPRARQLWAALRDATTVKDAREEVLTRLEAGLRGTPGTRTRCFAVGHAHIDTAWLWPIRETKRKCLRTFATALALMERYPEFRFLCSQAQQYVWLEEQAPELLARIVARVREGRWEPAGAMWVECDANVPSGESFVRQILHGTRTWQRLFGERGRQRLLYLPDTFGFSAALPQIARLAGLDTFITNKLGWNDTDEFPHVNFRWRGLDGSEILAHLTPGRDYNSANSPAELQRGELQVARKEAAGLDAWLQPYGYGDGGGGPNAEVIENARLAAECEGLPQTRLATAGELCDELHRKWRTLRAAGRDLPVWDGELYLEYHRGTYTTQSWLKRANRQAEQALRAAEWLTYAAPPGHEEEDETQRHERHKEERDRSEESSPAARAGDSARRLDEAWKTLLLNQFHDILPGSSIGWVYEDARRDHERIRATCAEVIEEAAAEWARAMDTRGCRAPLLVLNPASGPRSGVIAAGGGLHYVAEVPALGARVVDADAPAAVASPSGGQRVLAAVTVSGRKLSNGIVTATVDEYGQIVSLRGANDREACRPLRRPRGADAGAADDAAGERAAGEEAREALNQLVLYEDRPRAWDAWDLDAEYEETPLPLVDEGEDVARGKDTRASWRVVEAGPLRAAIEVSQPLGAASRITQRFVLDAGLPRLDVHTRIDWHERHRVLRVLFPVAVRARRATYEVQFGHLERPAHRNTPWDRAQFEVCAHRWVDLSEPGFGIALLNDGRFGHSCHDGVLGLTLARGPTFPDPEADQGVHEVVYSLMPHAGDWRAAGVDCEAEALNAPLRAVPLPPGQAGPLRETWAPFRIETGGAAGVEVTAVKRAEDDERLIVRLVETHGGAGLVTISWDPALNVSDVRPVDLLERPLDRAEFGHQASAGRTVFAVRPFQIVTLAAGRG